MLFTFSNHQTTKQNYSSIMVFDSRLSILKKYHPYNFGENSFDFVKYLLDLMMFGNMMAILVPGFATQTEYGAG